jgi:hypothetical protein
MCYTCISQISGSGDIYIAIDQHIHKNTRQMMRETFAAAVPPPWQARENSADYPLPLLTRENSAAAGSLCRRHRRHPPRWQQLSPVLSPDHLWGCEFDEFEEFCAAFADSCGKPPKVELTADSFFAAATNVKVRLASPSAG